MRDNRIMKYLDTEIKWFDHVTRLSLGSAPQRTADLGLAETVLRSCTQE